MKLAIVGVTGLVGSVLLKVLEEIQLPISQLIPMASKKSYGKLIHFNNDSFPVVSIDDALSLRPDVAIFSAGSEASLEHADKFAAIGCYVVDNSSAWRMNPNNKLIVPEINGSTLEKKDYIIANPNCSTIQLVMALSPLHNEFQMDRLIVSTYQSFTGTGVKAVNQYNAEKNNEQVSQKAYEYPIFENCIPHCDIFLDNDYTKEEMKIVNETRKILNNQDLRITATAVRVPVLGGHSESVNVSFHQEPKVSRVREILMNSEGITLLDNPKNSEYPMPLFAKDSNQVFVGRIRKDESTVNALNMWIVSDNLRKGAATNAVQIVKYLLEKNYIEN